MRDRRRGVLDRHLPAGAGGRFVKATHRSRSSPPTSARAALEKAREGTYLENIAQDVSPERLRRFFAKVDGHYQISKAIREMCVFARHDLARDPPFSRMDLISCRNVLIYLEPRLQERVFATFHYALSPAGFLVLGPAESVGASSALFCSGGREAQDLLEEEAGRPRALPLRAGRLRRREANGGGDASPPRPPSRSEVPREADRLLLARYGPAGVVVDEGLDILEFRGDTDPFLEHGHGQASLNLIRMARKGLLVELRQAIEEARKEGRALAEGRPADPIPGAAPQREPRGHPDQGPRRRRALPARPLRDSSGAFARREARRAGAVAPRRQGQGPGDRTALKREAGGDRRVPAHGRCTSTRPPSRSCSPRTRRPSPATKSCRA